MFVLEREILIYNYIYIYMISRRSSSSSSSTTLWTKKSRILHRAFEVTFGCSLRSRIQAVSQQPEHFIMHCLARPLSQGPDQ